MWKKKPKPVSDHLRRNAEYSLQKLEQYTNRRDNPSAINDVRTYVLDSSESSSCSESTDSTSSCSET